MVLTQTAFLTDNRYLRRRVRDMTATRRSMSCSPGMRLVPPALAVALLAVGCVGGEIQMADQPDRPACPGVPCLPGEWCDNGVCVPGNPDGSTDGINGPQQILVRPTVLNYANPTVGNEAAGIVTVTN